MTPVRKWPWMHCVNCALISALIGVGAWALDRAGSFQYLELKVYDLLINARPKDMSASSSIVIVQINEADIQALKHYPVSDAELARLLTRLLAYKPAAIGIDVFRDIQVPPGSAELQEVLNANDNIVAITRLGLVQPPPVYAQRPDQVGLVDFPVDADGVARRALIFAETSDDQPVYSLAHQLAVKFFQTRGVEPQWLQDGRYQFGKTTFKRFASDDGPYVNADVGGYQILMDFKGARLYGMKSLTDVLGGGDELDDIEGKIVLIGVTAASMKDFVPTPVSPMDFGVTLHARLVDQFLRAAQSGNPPMAFLTGWGEAIWILAWSLAGGFAGMMVRSPWRISLLLAGGATALVMTVYLLFASGVWLALIPPMATWLVSAGLVTSYISQREKRQRALITQLFSKHVSPQIVATIWDQRAQLLRRGRLHTSAVTATVLFTDLQGFTAMAADATPTDMLDWLNEYMDAMSAVVIRHGGMVNKYIGDAIMAVFGVPVARTRPEQIARDARQAVQCALEMRVELARLNARWRKEGRPTTAMRVGIYTGSLVAGSLGSSQRMEYTVIGDTVNIASRIENYRKEMMDPDIAAEGCRVLIGQSTFELLDGRFKTRFIEDAHLKGREGRPLGVHGVVGRDTSQ